MNACARSRWCLNVKENKVGFCGSQLCPVIQMGVKLTFQTCLKSSVARRRYLRVFSLKPPLDCLGLGVGLCKKLVRQGALLPKLQVSQWSFKASLKSTWSGVLKRARELEKQEAADRSERHPFVAEVTAGKRIALL